MALDEALAHTISARLVERLRQHILHGRDGYRPGDRILVDQLVNSLQISATPIKEALKLLVADGLVILRPRRGFYVVELSERELREIISLRECIERWSLKLAAGVVPQATLEAMATAVADSERASANGQIEGFIHADMHFHHLIAAVGENRVLQATHEQILMRSHIANYLYSPRIGNPSRESIGEHRELISVFGTGDLEKEEEALAAHWVRSLERMLAGYRDYVHANR
ncbi:MAG: GntR family transcriptional regulator [Chloroflexota bacterium]